MFKKKKDQKKNTAKYLYFNTKIIKYIYNKIKISKRLDYKNYFL